MSKQAASRAVGPRAGASLADPVEYVASVICGCVPRVG
jgi:hypothetical protein